MKEFVKQVLNNTGLGIGGYVKNYRLPTEASMDIFKGFNFVSRETNPDSVKIDVKDEEGNVAFTINARHESGVIRDIDIE